MEKQCWRVRFQDRPDEEGDLLYVVSEFIKSGLIYRYNVRQTQKQGINGHAHSFEGVLHAVLDDPDGFTIDGYESDYSAQEIEMLKAFKEQLEHPPFIEVIEPRKNRSCEKQSIFHGLRRRENSRHIRGNK